MNLLGCENFFIFLDNLSPYHVFFDVLAFAAFLTALWYCSQHINPSNNNQKINSEKEELKAETETDVDDKTASTLRTHRAARDLLSEISSNLSENELAEEQKVVKMQVEKIFELLRQQEEKFNVTSMDQVEDQLSLYR